MTKDSIAPIEGSWALILGASSGFGEAASIALARDLKMNIFGVHLDRRATYDNVERIKAAIQETGSRAVFFNVNAADEEKRQSVIESIRQELDGAEEGKKIRVLLHSLAFGTLKPYIADRPEDAINRAAMDMTVDVMAHSLVYWVQDLIRNNLFSRGGRVFGMTSAGDYHAWKAYGAVSAAKCALESHIRQLTLELAPFGITANSIRAGVTDTPALRKIPGNERMISEALRRNPNGRLTTPEDVAGAIVCLSRPEAQWITGNVIGVDGGEFVTD
ncbi:MAG: SDR family oxidoreductase [Armatimonadota bacterium]|nr:MAG: short-chain dehydrogenase [Armatimonadota bacterium]